MRNFYCLAGLACVLAFLLGGPAGAVELSHDGHGQVLIYPYYTIRSGQQSMLSLSNDTDAAKAVKLMVRGGVSGKALYVLNLYLAPHQTWRASLSDRSDSPGAGVQPALLGEGGACSVPQLYVDLPTLANGQPYLAANTDQDVAEPGEGYVVAIEMGVLHGSAAKATLPSGHMPAPFCRFGEFADAWQPGGFWSKDPGDEVSRPTGGLAGSMTIVNVARGMLFRAKPVALKDFRVAAMHSAPQRLEPDLGSALSDTSDGSATALVPLHGETVRSDYPANRAVDAVTAVLMAQRLTTKVDFRRGIAARSALVLTMPTKRFYVTDPGDPVAPFGRDEFRVTSPRGTLCSIIALFGDLAVYDSSSDDAEAHDVPKPCYATSVLALQPGARDKTMLGTRLRSIPALHDSGNIELATLRMNYYSLACFTDAPCDHIVLGQNQAFWRSRDYVRAHANRMRPDRQGRSWFGLPVVGFAATMFVNRNAHGPGRVANYTFAEPLDRAGRACAKAGSIGTCR